MRESPASALAGTPAAQGALPIFAILFGLPFGSLKIGYLVAFVFVFLAFCVLLWKAGAGRSAKNVAGWMAVGYVLGGVIPALMHVPSLP